MGILIGSLALLAEGLIGFWLMDGYHNSSWYKRHPDKKQPARGKDVDKRTAWTFGDSVTVGGVLVGVVLVVVIPPIYAKVPIFAGVCAGFVRLIWKSHWTHKWRGYQKVLIAFALVALICWFAVPQFVAQWHIEYPAKSGLANAPANPLEVVAFDANIKAMISNHSDKRIFVMDMQIAGELETNLITLALEIPPHEVQTAHLSVGQSKRGFHSMDRLSPVWKEHVQKTVQLYGSSCVAFDYFFPNDPDLLMMKEHYAKEGGILPLADAKGILHYRVEGTDETKSQPVDLIATTFVKNECKPTQVAPPAKPHANSHPKIRITKFVPDIAIGKPITLRVQYVNEGDETIKILSKYGFQWIETVPDNDAAADSLIEESIWKTMLTQPPIDISGTTSIATEVYLDAPPKMELQVIAFTNIVATKEILDKLDANSALYITGHMTDKTGAGLSEFCVRIDRYRNQMLTLCRSHN